MAFVESIGVAWFLMVIVFFALFGLYACIRLFSAAVSRLEGLTKTRRQSGDENDD